MDPIERGFHFSRPAAVRLCSIFTALVAAAMPAVAIAGASSYDVSLLLHKPSPFAQGPNAQPAVWPAIPPPTATAPQPAGGSGRSYDMNILLSQPHPFSNGTPQTYTPQAYTAPVGFNQQPDAPTVAQDPGAAAAPAEAAPDGARPGLWGVVSELRIGGVSHDTGPFSSHEEESAVDLNLEALFVSPDFLEFLWSPRPHLGGTINFNDDTSQVYFGLSWEFDIWRNVFFGFSFGGSVNDGETATDELGKKELGCHLLFRESVELGVRLAERHAITAYLDHISNANLCDRNEGLESAGIRYGYRF